MVASRSWTWHFVLRITSGWVVSFTGLITMVLATPSAWGNATNPSHQWCRYVQEKSFRELICVSPTTIHYTPFFHDSHPEPYITRLFSPPLKSFAPFCVIDVGFIKALLWRITSCRHQLIIQGVDLGTTPSVLWSLHASMASFSLPATGIVTLKNVTMTTYS